MFVPVAVISNPSIRKAILGQVDECLGIIWRNITAFFQDLFHTRCNALSSVLGILITTQGSVSGSADKKSSHLVGFLGVGVDELNSKARCRHFLGTIVVAYKIHDEVLESFDLELHRDDVQSEVVVKGMKVRRALKLAVVHPANKQLECELVELFVDKRSTKLSVRGCVCGCENLRLLHRGEEGTLADEQVSVDVELLLRSTNLEIGHGFVVTIRRKLSQYLSLDQRLGCATKQAATRLHLALTS